MIDHYQTEMVCKHWGNLVPLGERGPGQPVNEDNDGGVDRTCFTHRKLPLSDEQGPSWNTPWMFLMNAESRRNDRSEQTPQDSERQTSSEPFHSWHFTLDS
jgi:hypothetical protein